MSPTATSCTSLGVDDITYFHVDVGGFNSLNWRLSKFSNRWLDHSADITILIMNTKGKNVNAVSNHTYEDITHKIDSTNYRRNADKEGQNLLETHCVLDSVW
jgi:hypothetical protein